MKITLTKERFINLHFDEKLIILEELLTDDYFNGQSEIFTYIHNDFKGETGENLPEKPKEIKEVEDEKFLQLIESLTNKLFKDKLEIELD